MKVVDVFRTGTSIGNAARRFQASVKPLNSNTLKGKIGIDLAIDDLKSDLARLRIEGNETALHPACFAYILLGSGVFGNMTTETAKSAANWMIETGCDWRTAITATEKEQEVMSEVF